MTTDVPYRSLPVDQGDVHYLPGPDSSRRDDVPAGATTRLELQGASSFPGTRRSIWVHVPQAVDPNAPARVMVFNDGWWYLDPDGDVRGGVVLDNLVHQGAIPPLIGVFVDPGIREDGEKNRNREYDAFDARYADFLAEEVLRRWESIICFPSAPPTGASAAGARVETQRSRRPGRGRTGSAG